MSWALLAASAIGFALTEAPPTPRWAATWDMSRSTAFMPCNYSGMYNPVDAARWGLADFDWSNSKQLWANTKPMDCQERLVEQVKSVKAVDPSTRTFVYRNLVKALPWFSSVREKIVDPAYSGWFLKFKDGINGTYRARPCTGNKCSSLYHDQDQTPEHPHGDGSCKDDCDCGPGLPCGEYLWDHRNESLRKFLVEEFIMGPDGVGNAHVDGVFLDDSWHDSSHPRKSWWPKEGFCDADIHGGPTEEYPNCTVDMGLTAEDTRDITGNWSLTVAEVQKALVAAGAFGWKMFLEENNDPENPAVPDTAACKQLFESECRAGGGTRYASPWMYQFTDAHHQPLIKVKEDLAVFLLARGPYAWIGYGWIGCVGGASSSLYARPAQLDVDYGAPVDDYCHGDAAEPGVYRRSWSKADVSFDCNTLQASIILRDTFVV